MGPSFFGRGGGGLQTTEQYILSTAIAATASRYGGELPGLFRILISHHHMR